VKKPQRVVHLPFRSTAAQRPRRVRHIAGIPGRLVLPCHGGTAHGSTAQRVRRPSRSRVAKGTCHATRRGRGRRIEDRGKLARRTLHPSTRARACRKLSQCDFVHRTCVSLADRIRICPRLRCNIIGCTGPSRVSRNPHEARGVRDMRQMKASCCWHTLMRHARSLARLSSRWQDLTVSDIAPSQPPPQHGDISLCQAQRVTTTFGPLSSPYTLFASLHPLRQGS
jgi:hypothetical protein